MSTTLLTALRGVNAELRKILTSDPAKVASEPNPRSLGERLQQVGRELPDLAAGRPPDTATQAEISQYVQNLEEVKNSLEALQAMLREERSRLVGEGTHLQAARAWASSMKETG